MALTATPKLPSSAVLKPTGMLRLEGQLAARPGSRSCGAPIAVHEIRSARYCGTIGSSISVAAGIPSSAMSRSRERALQETLRDVGASPSPGAGR